MNLATAETAHGMQLAEHGSAIEQMKAQHQAQLDRAAAERDRLKAEHDMVLKSAQTKHAMALKEMESRHKMELAAKAQKAAARSKKKEKQQ